MSEDAKNADEYDCDTSFYSLFVAFRYYRSVEYCVESKSYMYTRRPYRLQHDSKNTQESPSSDDGVIQRRVQSKKRRTRLKEAEVEADFIGCTEGSIKSVKIIDNGLDESDEDCVSDDGSIVSGPSFQPINSPKKPRASQNLCSDCWKLYQKAKKTKAPVKDKLLDNDPTSLTCDQWVLLKQWRPRRLPDARGNLLMLVQQVKKGADQSQQCSGDSSPCSRPHAFLKRNLRRRVRASLNKERKKNRRKRARDDSQGSRIAKQRRLRGNDAGRHAGVNGADVNGADVNGADDSGLHSPGFEGNGSEENDDGSDVLVVEVNPSSLSSRPTDPVRVSPRHKMPKQKTEFKDLLAQLRRNSSMIVKESR